MQIVQTYKFPQNRNLALYKAKVMKYNKAINHPGNPGTIQKHEKEKRK